MDRVRRDDEVEVISGDFKGRRGKVLRVDREKGRVLVEGVNQVWKHLRKSQEHPHGARIQREAPMAVSKVMVVCQSCRKAARIRIQITAEREHVRICKKCKQAVRPATA